MRILIVVAVLFGSSTSPALAQAPSVTPLAPGASTHAREAVSARKSEFEAAVADCEGMWDRGTHMTKQEWSRTCRRVQDRLQQLKLR
jgi:hypothetical protein